MAAILVSTAGCGEGGSVDEAEGQAAGALYSAGSTIQAESFTSKSSPNPQLENGNTTIGFFDAGTWLCFADVDMTNVTGLNLRMATANTGGVFSVRLDSNTGTEIGRYTVATTTGGWGTWETRAMPLAPASGVHSLCLSAESGGGFSTWIGSSSSSLPPLTTRATPSRPRPSPANRALSRSSRMATPTWASSTRARGSASTPWT